MSHDTSARTGNLRSQVYELLRQQLQDGELAPGAIINMATLVETLGVGRTPLREALLQLQAERLVEILPQRGMRVCSLGIREIEEIYEIVGALESRVLAGVHRMSKADLKLMKKINATMRKLQVEDDRERYYRANRDFHNVILAQSQNRQLVEYVKIQKLRLYDFPKRDYGRSWMEKNSREHAEFVRLLEEDGARAASSYWRDVHWHFVPMEPDA